MFFSYTLFKLLYEQEDSGWGNGLRYGKMSIIAAISQRYETCMLNKNVMFNEAKKQIEKIKPIWTKFEEWMQNQEENKLAYGEKNFDFDNYYKGKTVDKNIIEFFKKSTISQPALF
jgi:hypothetical protein